MASMLYSVLLLMEWMLLIKWRLLVVKVEKQARRSLLLIPGSARLKLDTVFLTNI